MTPVTVISGGQTGVDTAALLAAEAFSLPISGYVPLHYSNELGSYSIPERFRADLVETDTTASALRTELNIKQADGVLTLLSAEDGRSDVSKGTQLGIDYARALGKVENQLCFVDLTSLDLDADVERVVRWLVDRKVSKCAIGGPRESEVPGIERQAETFLLKVFDLLENISKASEHNTAKTASSSDLQVNG
ncbi:hypothetical protein LTR05_008365 [Lithohypha guttulata]|uniref:Molybdenum carrier n=1 Tax=Lithohypha guttulata TaxID=1690604 RepID=A0AAN7QAG5_9EURO|nr:hypothetical protein LTR05_008365 [Lithohypha guttulata]